jgi:hypothetical protein
MTTFVALYRGETVASARLIAVTADPLLVADVSSRLLGHRSADEPDLIVAGLERARRSALRQIHEEASHEPGV